MIENHIPDWLLKTIKFENNNYYCHICNGLINISNQPTKCNNNSLHFFYHSNFVLFQFFINNKAISNMLDIKRKVIICFISNDKSNTLNLNFDPKSFSFQWVEDKIKNNILI